MINILLREPERLFLLDSFVSCKNTLVEHNYVNIEVMGLNCIVTKPILLIFKVL